MDPSANFPAASTFTPDTSGIDRLAPTRRPRDTQIGYQQWRNLAFAHWSVDVAELQPLLPPSLTVDTWNGRAWVGLVPFQMRNVRPRFLPAVPGISNFPETNVRTYVHHHGQNPGVWFFSLDAAHSLAVRIARWKWHLNYFRSDMSVEEHGNRLRYQSRRLWPAPVPAETNVVIVRTADTAQPGATRTAAPASLEHFLCERYILYTQDAGGALRRGQVHHAPYPLEEATLEHCEQSLLPAAGLEITSSPEHVLFSPGVDVEIFPLRRI